MTLIDLKVEPEEAVTIITNDLTEGYRLKDSLWEQYRSKKDQISGEDIEKFHTLNNSWFQKTIGNLQSVFMTTRQAYLFRDPEPTAFQRLDVNSDFDRIMTSLESRLRILNGFIEFVFEHSRIQIAAGRDINLQAGDNSKMEVKN